MSQQLASQQISMLIVQHARCDLSYHSKWLSKTSAPKWVTLRVFVNREVNAVIEHLRNLTSSLHFRKTWADLRDRYFLFFLPLNTARSVDTCFCSTAAVYGIFCQNGTWVYFIVSSANFGKHKTPFVCGVYNHDSFKNTRERVWVDPRCINDGVVDSDGSYSVFVLFIE